MAGTRLESMPAVPAQRRAANPIAGRPGTASWSGTFNCAPAAPPSGTEVRAGMTTFMVMAYIIFVNPAMLCFAGIPISKAARAALSRVLRGHLPPGRRRHRHGAVLQLSVCHGSGARAQYRGGLPAARPEGLTWPAAMGVFFREGLIITILVLTGLRETIIHAIPLSLKRATAVGIGLFILSSG